jgi:hypothetical protein
MKNFFDSDRVAEIQGRLATLRPDAKPLWGIMNAPQAMAHCSAGLETAFGERLLPRMRMERFIGWIIKPMVMGDDKPFRRNSATIPGLAMSGVNGLEFEAERKKLSTLIDRFAAEGPRTCTTHPHSFFGVLTPDEWAILMYKHLDHHLRQFGA